MNIIVYYIVTIILIISSVYACFVPRKYKFTIGEYNCSYNNYMHFIFILIVSSFFFGGHLLTFIRIGVYLLLSFFVILSKNHIKLPAKRIIYSFLIFYAWIAFTMSYSKGLYEGSMMLIKYSIPFFFYISAYKSLKSRDEYISWIMRVNFFIVIYIFINGIPALSFVGSWFGGQFFGGASTYQMATFIAIPISLYFMTGQKKFLLHAFCYFLPSVTRIRRAAFAAIFMTTSIMMFWRNKLRALLTISVALFFIIIAIFSIKPLQERFFGGDKGKWRATSVTMETIEEDGLSKHLNTSGRDAMWSVVLKRFFYDSPIAGVGLGTLKAYITSSDSEGGRAFLLLHNDYLQLMTETGIVGLTLWIIFILFVFYEIFDTLRHSDDSLLIYSALIALCSLTAILFIMYFANILSTPMRFMQPFIMFGFFMRLKYMKTKMQ